jgi:hypothetical protein
LQAKTVRVLVVLPSCRSKKKLAAVIREETHFLSNEENEERNEDDVESETTGVGKHVEDADAAIRQEQQGTEAAGNAGVMTREPQKTFREMIVAIGDSLSHIASCNYDEDGDDEND